MAELLQLLVALLDLGHQLLGRERPPRFVKRLLGQRAEAAYAVRKLMRLGLQHAAPCEHLVQLLGLLLLRRPLCGQLALGLLQLLLEAPLLHTLLGEPLVRRLQLRRRRREALLRRGRVDGASRRRAPLLLGLIIQGALQLLLPLLQVVAQVALESRALLLRLCGVALRLDAPLREPLYLGLQRLALFQLTRRQLRLEGARQLALDRLQPPPVRLCRRPQRGKRLLLLRVDGAARRRWRRRRQLERLLLGVRRRLALLRLGLAHVGQDACDLGVELLALAHHGSELRLRRLDLLVQPEPVELRAQPRAAHVGVPARERALPVDRVPF
mmetsp:Transcript_17732/g.59550  ORF Transcript_17732/g.59550 Transcript_17732/m.59550 type:complete len:327 (+) Transcript_17732:673-1653(+)